MKDYLNKQFLSGDFNKEESYVLKDRKSLDPLIERIGDAHCVLLGEASHGTHEYYTWRSAISKRLIEEKGFDFIAVEGDWPDCYRLNRYIKGYDFKDKKPEEILKNFRRWPTWMWANWEIAALTTWLKDYNSGLLTDNRVGFYGLDVYSFWESMDAIDNYLKGTVHSAASIVKNAVKCFEPYGRDEYKYAKAYHGLEGSCRKELVNLLVEIRKNAVHYDHDPEAGLNVEQNAHVLVNAEEYYRHMTGTHDYTWNLRDTHMMETLHRLFKYYGPAARGIVWEHNTHIGDARYTDMLARGLINIGQLVREEMGADDVVLVGFGSYQGNVMAGEEWSAPMQVMDVPPAKKGSVEEILHTESAENKLMIFDKTKTQRFDVILPHRAIGVVYHSKHEKYGNYVSTILSSRYDAFIYLDETTALHPLHFKPDGHQVPESYPFAF
jgi:erythromycin esterase